jgi:Zn-dependent M16 (insulinase) family peptidase
VRASLDDKKQNVFQITVQNANPEDRDKFRDIVMKTFREVKAEGLDKEAVEGTLNRIEFGLREGDDAQKGLTYNFQGLTGWFFADDPFLSLEYEKPLTDIKAKIKKGYLESVIQKYMLDNPHALILVMQPKPDLEKENNTRIDKELDEFKTEPRNWSPTKKEKIVPKRLPRSPCWISKTSIRKRNGMM